jgi:membrane protein implicated in regulation of membrane protease activity
MSTASVVYLICFGVGLLFALVSAFMADVFGGHELASEVGTPALGGAESHVEIESAEHGETGSGGHAEAGLGEHGMPGFSPLCPTTIATFVTAFGGIGLILSQLRLTRSPWLSAPLAFLGGFGVAALVFWIFQTIFQKTQASSESEVAMLIGAPATVVTPINTNAVGEIAYVDGGTRYTAPARGEGGLPYTTGQAVKITRIVGTTYYVARA